MELVLNRIDDDGETTIGALYDQGVVERLCFTLEDQEQEVKVAGETRIPAGRYKIIPRTYGRFFEAYKERWGHDFALEVENVPGFTDILIHTGVIDDHTEGCILVGFGVNKNKLTESRNAYNYLFGCVRHSVLEGECYITVNDN